MSPTAKNKVYVTFWGTRGSISTPGSGTEKYGGNTACVSITCNSARIILDAGTGIRNLGIELAQEARDLGTGLDIHLLLSHTHWDHIQGLPFFTPAYIPNNKITIYGSPKKGNFLEGILQRQMDVNYFPVEMNALAAEVTIREISTRIIEIGPVKVEWQEQVCHPGGSVRYKLSVNGTKIVYATDVELDMIYGDKKTKDADRLAAEYEAFIAQSDLLIADGQYTAAEYTTHAGFGHTSMPLLIDVAHAQRVKQLAVFHHEPLHSDSMIDRICAQTAPKYAAATPAMNLFWAREGMTIAI